MMIYLLFMREGLLPWVAARSIPHATVATARQPRAFVAALGGPNAKKRWLGPCSIVVGRHVGLNRRLAREPTRRRAVRPRRAGRRRRADVWMCIYQHAGGGPVSRRNAADLDGRPRGHRRVDDPARVGARVAPPSHRRSRRGSRATRADRVARGPRLVSDRK